MANPEHLAILKQGVDVWNEWRKQEKHVVPDLSDADLKGADLIEASLSHANLTGAFLTGGGLNGRKPNKRQSQRLGCDQRHLPARASRGCEPPRRFSR
jgi:hypothetical protein